MAAGLLLLARAFVCVCARARAAVHAVASAVCVRAAWREGVVCVTYKTLHALAEAARMNRLAVAPTAAITR